MVTFAINVAAVIYLLVSKRLFVCAVDAKACDEERRGEQLLDIERAATSRWHPAGSPRMLTPVKDQAKKSRRGWSTGRASSTGQLRCPIRKQFDSACLRFLGRPPNAPFASRWPIDCLNCAENGYASVMQVLAALVGVGTVLAAVVAGVLIGVSRDSGVPERAVRFLPDLAG